MYFEEVWPASAEGQINDEFAVRRGVWIDSEQIDALFFIEPPDASPSFREHMGELLRAYWRRVRGHSALAPETPPTTE